MITGILRFLAVSLGAYALANAFPVFLLAGPAWLAWLLAPVLGIVPLGPPVFDGAVILYAHGAEPLRLEDPYILAGIPLFLGIWAAPRARSLPRALFGVFVLEAFAGITVALVALTVARGWIETPAREPMELVALAFVAAIRVLPVPLWMALDPSWRTLMRPRRSSSR